MTVGIIGYGGETGKGIAEYLLKKNYLVYGAQRHGSGVFQGYSNFEQDILDAGNTENVKAFASKCDMLINCAAPSYRYSSGIARAAGEAGTVYLDLTECAVSDDLPGGGIYITSCGYIPGLSGILPKFIMDEYFDTVDSVITFQGSSQLCSDRALKDIVLSAGKTGYVDACCSNGKVEKLAVDHRKRFALPFIGEEVILKPYLSEEMKELAIRADIRELKSFNVYENASQFTFFLRLMAALASEDTSKADALIGSERRKRAGSDEAAQSVLLGEVSGSRDGTEKCVRYHFSTADMNNITSAAAGVIADRVLRSEVDPGTYFAWQFADRELISELKNCFCKDDHFDIEEIPAGMSFDCCSRM